MTVEPQPDSFALKIENTRGLSQGIALPDECLASIAVSLKRIADRLDSIHDDLESRYKWGTA